MASGSHQESLTTACVDWGDGCSMRKGGGSMFCKILESAPSLKTSRSIAPFFLHAKNPSSKHSRIYDTSKNS
ncbi:hypothetical protein PCANC_00512 [Puccinia coronata f. sp. avenae]|uniref:Uncharacterized protein n=1 Tax=Puccinia coronata f. sp. avenae TaxID=200324 RepID=A0A2N5W7Y1_9BASI|nr:hypothetical protein PCANC_00512 [Puccinia coronata f. sp. avenae]